MMREHDEDPEQLNGPAQPVDEEDILEELDETEERRLVRSDFFDDDPFADDGDLDYEDEPSF